MDTFEKIMAVIVAVIVVATIAVMVWAIATDARLCDEGQHAVMIGKVFVCVDD